MIKICKDCGWFEESTVSDYSKCNNPKNIKINLVTGEKEYVVDTAYNMRYNERSGCGRFGLWFKSKSQDKKQRDDVRPSYVEMRNF
jgi:hypothetical protein